MNQHSKRLIAIIPVLAVALVGLIAYAQDHSNHQGQHQCKGCQGKQQGEGKMQGPGGMQGMMGRGEGRMEDMQTIHTLFDEHKKITRAVRKIENGVETLTESDDPKVQALIVEHVRAMQKRLENKQPIRMWDPLFAELFKNADKIKMEIVKTPKGVKVIETSDDPWVIRLIQSHAEGVSEFVREGPSSMHKSHELPGEKSVERKFLGKGDGVTTCPVTGEPVNKEIKFGFYGRTVYFCCESCRDAVKKSPELYLKP